MQRTIIYEETHTYDKHFAEDQRMSLMFQE